MPLQRDFSISYEDGVLTISMTPPVDITNWTVQFQMMKRAKGTPILTKNMASGYVAGESGLTVVNAGEGFFNANLTAPEVSGLNDGNYFFLFQRTDSGSVTSLAEGYRALNF